MLLSDLLAEVLGDLRKRWLRTGLTLTGIVAGTLLITLMVAIGEGLRDFLETQMRAVANPRLIHVFPEKIDFRSLLLDQLMQLGAPPREVKDDDEWQAMRRMMIRGPRFMTREETERILEIEGVVAVWPGVILNARWVRFEGDDRRWTVHAIPWGWAHVDFIPLQAGRRFSSDDASEVILSHHYLDSLGLSRPEELIGRKVTIPVDPIWIPGVGSPTSPLSLLGGDPDPVLYEAEVVGLMKRTLFSTAAIVPHGRSVKLARQVQEDPDLFGEVKHAMMAQVLVDEEERVPEVVQGIKDLDLGAKAEAERYAAFAAIFLFINSALSIVGIAALAVAALGIANTLLMSIYERTREIGLYLALGGTRRMIRRLFAIEAAAIGIIGGLVGIGVALLVGKGVNVLFHVIFPSRWEGYEIFTFPAWLLVGTVLFATLVATVAGIFPALRASRLDPIAALRYD